MAVVCGLAWYFLGSNGSGSNVVYVTSTPTFIPVSSPFNSRDMKVPHSVPNFQPGMRASVPNPSAFPSSQPGMYNRMGVPMPPAFYPSYP